MLKVVDKTNNAHFGHHQSETNKVSAIAAMAFSPNVFLTAK